jgi:hypothetical protein
MCEKEMTRLSMPGHSCAASKYITYPSQEVEHSSSDEASVSEVFSLDSKLNLEIQVQRKLQERIRSLEADSGQIHKQIAKLKSECDGEVAVLTAELQLRHQEMEECEMKALKQAQETRDGSEAKKYQVMLELEKVKHKYDIKIKELELELERKKTLVAEKEAEANRKESLLKVLQAQIEMDRVQKEKEKLMETSSREIEDLKRRNAELERQLQLSQQDQKKRT